MLKLGLPLAAVVILLDQWAKTHILDYFLPAGPGAQLRIDLLPFANLVLVWNRGVSFGLLSNASPLGPYVLALVALAISLALGIWLSRTRHAPTAIGLGLVIGGALGNVIDRLRFGAVVDYLDLHAAGWHWPAFNVADAAISVGVAGLLLASLLDTGGGTRVRGEEHKP
jgi:signal peptidase II